MNSEKERYYEYGGYTVVATRFDPYGFISVHIPEMETLPHELSGYFSTFGDVERALETYFNNK